ncbi:type II toxin-antitoxin system prevent-host-death family antitoxin [Mycobacterium intracellulare]|uniref:type II toxin-antitoxin system prevent-host-death family antitoxin n=1 Tax=Mycobacterium intracellulare TaxID=1767 RepID=UPI0034D4D49C
MGVEVPIGEAQARLSELVRQSADDDVVLVDDSGPAAVVMSADRYDALLEDLEDLRDRLSVHERTGVTISADKFSLDQVAPGPPAQ